MWFGFTIRNARLQLTVLNADCQTSAGDWQQSQLDLDHYLGNKDGVFDWRGEKFNSTAENLRLEDTTLSARLQTRQFKWLEASVDLNYHLINEDGHVMIVDHSGFAESSRNAVMDGGVLQAECFTSTGEVRKSSINLDEYIGIPMVNFTGARVTSVRLLRMSAWRVRFFMHVSLLAPESGVMRVKIFRLRLRTLKEIPSERARACRQLNLNIWTPTSARLNGGGLRIS
jgi:hypothetical protein